MKRIAFIIPYYGKFNNYFNLWLESCRANSTVDWYVITDNHDVYNFPSNVHKVMMGLDEVRHRFNVALNMNIALTRPYKFCDLKPSFGYIFPEIIKEYDFWGWCDVDLIWGNIRSFLTEEVLENYDMISRWGHCTLIKNTKANNCLFMSDIYLSNKKRRVSFWQEAFSSDKAYIFDETPFLLYAMDKGLRIYNIESKHYDCNINSYSFSPAVHQACDITSFGHDVFHWSNGQLQLLTASKDKIERLPLLYAHFQKRPMKNHVHDNMDYYITDHDFVNVNTPKKSVDIIRMSSRRFVDFTMQKRFLQKVQRKFFQKGEIQFYHWPSYLLKEKERIWKERYCINK